MIARSIFAARNLHTLRPRNTLREFRWWMRFLCVLLAAVCAYPPSVKSQNASPISMTSTRFEITSRLSVIESALASTTTKGKARERLANEARDLRARLQTGDFRVGERFTLTFIKDSVRTDSITVRDSMLVGIANLPDLSLRGVLRSELTSKVSSFMAEYFKNATVRTQILTRISVMGEVNRPGFYYVAPDRPLSEALTIAGGPSATADIMRLEIRRSGSTILSARKSEQAVKDGKTLEEMAVQSGDEIRIPIKRKFNWALIVQVMLLASSLFFALVNFLRYYYSQQSP